jgi:hypothetical protein
MLELGEITGLEQLEDEIKEFKKIIQNNNIAGS